MIIHANVLDIPPDLVASCDVMLTDPPYSAHVHENAMSSRTAGAGPVSRDLGFGPLTDDLRTYLALCASVVKRWSIVCCDLESTHLWRASMAAVGVEYIRELPWIRWSQPQISGDRPPTGAEAVLHFHAMGPAGPRGGAPKPLAKTWNGPGGLTHYDATSMRGNDKHPTEKPLALGLTIVASFSNPDETLFLPCEGRGTFAQACRMLGRDCIAVEGDSIWAAEAELRTTAPYDKRDRAAAAAWGEAWYLEAIRALEENTDPRCQPSRDRAQRRLDDAERVRKELNK